MRGVLHGFNKYLLGGLAGVPWVVARNVSLSYGSG